MTLPSSGALSFSAIGTELGDSNPLSLHEMSQTAGFSTPDAVSDFYGYSHASYTLSLNETWVQFALSPAVVCGTSDLTITITVTTEAGNSWMASVYSGTTWIAINGVTNGTASDTGSGSFTIGCGKALGARNGLVKVTSGAPTAEVTVVQDTCP